MTAPPWSYRLPKDASAEELTRQILALFRSRLESEPAERYTYLDTFDGRLYAAGATLDLRANPHGALLRWRNLAGEPRHRLWVDKPPRFAWDLPRSELRDAIVATAKVRRLLPQVTVRSESRSIRVLNEDRKTYARVRLERLQVSAPEGPAERTLPLRLRVVPVRGYEEEAERLARALEERFPLDPDEPAELAACLRALGREPPAPRKRLRVPLSPDLSAGEAVRRILVLLARTMRANEQGLVEDLDTEFLHDFRVALRRTRTALSLLGDVFAPDEVERFGREFAWLSRETGPARDADVYLLAVRDYRLRVAPELEADLAPFDAFLAERRRGRAAAVAAVLRGERYARLAGAWERFLLPGGAAPAGPAQARPAAEFASERIWAAWKRFRRRARTALAEETPEALHRARIAGKRLRYLLEFFRGLFPGTPAGDLIAAMRETQDLLGQANDRAVQSQAIASDALAFAAAHDPAPRTLLAIGRLIERLERQGRRASERSHAALEQRIAAESRALFRDLVRPRPDRP